MNWFRKIAYTYAYHGTDPEKVETIKINGLDNNSFFAGNEDDISPYADGVWLRFPFPSNYQKRIGRGDYYTTLEIIPPENIEIKTNPWGEYEKLV